MAASFDVRDWIGWGAERNDPAWKSKATAWFNELTQYARETRTDLDTEVAELDSHITDFNDHLADAGWAGGGTTAFERAAENSDTRVSDKYTASTAVQKYINDVRVEYDNEDIKIQYDDAGANEIYRLDRANRRFEHHSDAILTGAANYYTNWGNYGGGYASGNWYRLPSGLVKWEGLVRRSTSASGAPNAILLTNGSGRATRPIQLWACISSSGAARVDHFANGQLVTQTSIGTNGFVSLDGISYLDEWR